MAIKTNLLKLLRDERGATAIEYGLIVSLIVIAIIGGMGAVASKTNEMWNRVSSTTEAAMNNSGN